MTGPAVAVVGGHGLVDARRAARRRRRPDPGRRRAVGARPAGRAASAPARDARRAEPGRAAARSPTGAGSGTRHAGVPGAGPAPRPAARGARCRPPGPATGRWFTPPLLGGLRAAAPARRWCSPAARSPSWPSCAHLGHLSFTGVVFVVWGVTSIVGGFVYGALHREISPPVVLLGLAVLTLPDRAGRGAVAVAAAGRASPGCSAPPP